MSFVSEKATIEQYVQANYASTLVKYENDEMNDSSASEWIRVSTQNADAFQASLGSNPLFRYVGVLFVQIFVKPDIGSGRALELADTISTLFRAKRIGGIVFLVPKVQKVGVFKDWYQVNVSVEFSREE